MSKFSAGLLALTVCAAASLALAAPTTVRMSIDEDPIVIRLANSLGYLAEEGIEIVPVDLEKISGEDYLMQEPLVQGKIDASYHWFNHTVFGARHNLPITAVMLINDAPGMTVMVANRVKGGIRSAADFKGKNVAEGAEYGTKALITRYLAKRAGLPEHSYTPVMIASEGRREAVLSGLKEAKVDVMTFQEPMTSALTESNLVSVLYDLNSNESTTKALGAAFPAQSLLVAPGYIAAHPDTVQRLVNVLVRTMRFVNSHTAEEIAVRLPPGYFDHKDRQAEIGYIRKTLSTYAKGDYSFSPASVKLIVDSITTYDFDKSKEGQWRATGDNSKIRVDQLYTNRFVNKAMQEIK